MKKTFFLLYYYVPKSQLKKTKEAVFKAGGGKMGNYSHCAWQTDGLGQFKPEQNSKPHIGKQEEISKVQEYKVEIICELSKIDNIISSLKNAHPYEHPAIGVIKLENLE